MKISQFKYRNQLEVATKIALIALAGYFVISKLQNSQYEGIFSYRWRHIAWLLPGFFTLWGVNLMLDAAIWRKVHDFIAPLSWKRAFKTNFICYALAFITPANTGELAGRYVMLSENSLRQKTVFLTFWSHLPRLMVKLLLGGGSLLVLMETMNKLSPYFMWAGLAVLIPGVLVFYLRFNGIQRWLGERGWRQFKLRDYLMNDHPKALEKWQLLSLATLKYLSYNFQFVLLLLLWGGGGFNLEMLAAVFVFYFISAVIPTFAAADFLIKGALALLIFPSGMVDSSLLINASFIVWAFNIALPALTGSIIIFKTNLRYSLKKKFSPGNQYGPSH